MSKPVIYQGREFVKIHKFDCHLVHLDNFYTGIPISPKEYRDRYPTKARAEIEETRTRTIFHVWSDYGDKFVMSIPNEMEEEISAARDGAESADLLNKVDRWKE